MVHSNNSNVRGLAYCTCGSETLHLLPVSLVSISALPPSLIARSRWQSCAG